MPKKLNYKKIIKRSGVTDNVDTSCKKTVKQKYVDNLKVLKTLEKKKVLNENDIFDKSKK